MDGDVFSRKVKELQSELERYERDAPDRACMQFSIIVGVLWTVLVAIILTWWNPSFVQCPDKHGKKERSVKRIFWYTFILSIAGWLAIFLISHQYPSVACIKF